VVFNKTFKYWTLFYCMPKTRKRGNLFRFIYDGEFDCLIDKSTFERCVQSVYLRMKTKFKVRWTPAKFVVTMESNPLRKKAIGGTTDFDRKYDIVYRLRLQLHGYPLKEQTFKMLFDLFEYTLTHEMMHFFIPSVQNNSCWSEGVTDFMTFWFLESMPQNLLVLKYEYANETNLVYKRHRFGYVKGFQRMHALYVMDPTVVQDIIRMIQTFNKNTAAKKKVYAASDIASYNSKFKDFFIGKCNTHIKFEYDSNFQTSIVTPMCSATGECAINMVKKQSKTVVLHGYNVHAIFGLLYLACCWRILAEWQKAT